MLEGLKQTLGCLIYAICIVAKWGLIAGAVYLVFTDWHLFLRIFSYLCIVAGALGAILLLVFWVKRKIDGE